MIKILQSPFLTLFYNRLVGLGLFRWAYFFLTFTPFPYHFLAKLTSLFIYFTSVPARSIINKQRYGQDRKGHGNREISLEYNAFSLSLIKQLTRLQIFIILLNYVLISLLHLIFSTSVKLGIAGLTAEQAFRQPVRPTRAVFFKTFFQSFLHLN